MEKTSALKPTRFLQTTLVLLVILVNIGCDQVSKSMVREHLGYQEKVELFRHNVILTNVENTGAFLSLGEDLPAPYKTVFLLLLPGIVLALALWTALFTAGLHRNVKIGLGFLVGGGIGNIFDRVLYGSVTDFLHIDLDVVQTGIFNLADVSIMAGIFLILIQTAILAKQSST